MDEQLRERLEKYLETIEEAASQAGGFVMEQAPLVVQEYLAWRFWSDIFACVISVVIATAVFFLAGYLRDKATKWKADSWEDKNNRKGSIAACFIAQSLAIGLTFIPVGIATFDAVKVSVAPRVVLIEKVADLRNPKPRCP